MTVKIYSTPTCGFCNMAKRYFRERSIKFIDYNIAKDERKAKFIVQKTGQKGVPVIDINGKFIVGFDKAKIDRLINHAK